MFQLSSTFLLSIFTLFYSSFSFSCNSSQQQIQIFTKQILSNGCSKPSSIKIKGEEDFTYCCDLHDACYSSCSISKDYCDNDFLKCMLKLCNVYFEKQKNECLNAAEVYSLGTKIFGQKGFLETQQDYCDCIDSEKYEITYQKGIEFFYSKYAPNSEIDITKVLNKYKNSIEKKYSKLYYDLHKKYYHAIGLVDERKLKQNIPTLKNEL